jgi:hypothetical protein
MHPQLLGIAQFEELPQGLYGNARANALAVIDGQYQRNAIIVADLSYDPSYAEVLYDTFGRRVVGVHITSRGDGLQAERRLVRNGSILVYTVGRSYLLDNLHSLMESRLVRLAQGPESKRAYEQLMALQAELREHGIVYKCPSGGHDDLAMSCAMVAWAARHPHVSLWQPQPPRPRSQGRLINGRGWT